MQVGMEAWGFTFLMGICLLHQHASRVGAAGEDADFRRPAAGGNASLAEVLAALKADLIGDLSFIRGPANAEVLSFSGEMTCCLWMIRE